MYGEHQHACAEQVRRQIQAVVGTKFRSPLFEHLSQQYPAHFGYSAGDSKKKIEATIAWKKAFGDPGKHQASSVRDEGPPSTEFGTPSDDGASSDLSSDSYQVTSSSDDEVDSDTGIKQDMEFVKMTVTELTNQVMFLKGNLATLCEHTVRESRSKIDDLVGSVNHWRSELARHHDHCNMYHQCPDHLNPDGKGCEYRASGRCHLLHIGRSPAGPYVPTSRASEHGFYRRTRRHLRNGPTSGRRGRETSESSAEHPMTPLRDVGEADVEESGPFSVEEKSEGSGKDNMLPLKKRMCKRRKIEE